MKHKFLAIILTIVMLLGITPITAYAASVSSDKTNYCPGERMRVTVTGVDQQMQYWCACVCVCKLNGSTYQCGREYDFTNVGTNILYIAAPTEPGDYFLRLYGKGNQWGLGDFIMSVPIKVGNYSSPPSINMTMSVEKTTFAPGESFNVTVSNAPSFAQYFKGSVLIREPGSGHQGYIGNAKIFNTPGQHILEFAAPATAGNYELRLYNDHDFRSDASFVMKIPFTVAIPPISGMKMSMNGSKFIIAHEEGLLSAPVSVPFPEIIVTVTNIEPKDVSADARVYIYKVNSGAEQYIAQERINSTGTQAVSFMLDLTIGHYETRLYLNGANPSPGSLVAKVPFDVTKPPSQIDNLLQLSDRLKNIRLTKKYFKPGEWITADIVGGINPADLRDLGAGMVISKANQSHIEFEEIIGLDNLNFDKLNFSAPDIDGEYELRIYSDMNNRSADTVLTSLSFSVSKDLEITDIPSDPGRNKLFEAMAIDSGVRLEWPVNREALYYRVYRSKILGEEGISITDFAIDSTKYIDVNVDADTTYYYSMRALLKEASAITGERETLSKPTAQVSVKTGAEILGGNASDMGTITKNAILMKLDDPYMSVNGLVQEIDPGRGTSPQIVFGRTIVPIRAIIETMLGKIEWEDATQKITLNANNHNVVMWLNKKELVVDGQNQTMDVAPVSVNGRTMVPVRFAAENVGCVVDWIASTKEIVVVFYS